MFTKNKSMVKNVPPLLGLHTYEKDITMLVIESDKRHAARSVTIIKMEM